MPDMSERQTAYTFADRLLHRLALGPDAIAEMSFDLDQALAKPDTAPVRAQRHVFISGLARAGTTILMRRFHASGCFRSLTYRDMPFVLAPNLWARLSARSRQKARMQERAHGDGLAVSVDSPESLDEVFWRVFAGSSYLKPDRLVPHQPETRLVRQFAAYVAAILKSDGAGRRRYLSKNNNNILRLEAIARAFPQALILIPFRDPLHHANSLRRQHLRFCALHREDRFAKDYMTWLSHHEFGLDHRRFVFVPGRKEELDPAGLDYWLDLWRETYAWLLENHPPSAVFVCYEDLCLKPGYWPALARLGGLEEASDKGEVFTLRQHSLPSAYDPMLAKTCRNLYDRLRQTAKLKLENSFELARTG